MASNSLQNTHVKLLAFDFLSLTPTLSSSSSSSDSISFLRNGVRISRLESVGVVVSRDSKPDKFLRFSIDDGTGCIPCILWLNHLTSPFFSRRRPPDVRPIARLASDFSDRAQIGHVVRVRGRVSGFRGSVQVTVDDVVVEKDPNAEILHWLQCVKLARDRYDAISYELSSELEAKQTRGWIKDHSAG